MNKSEIAELARKIFEFGNSSTGEWRSETIAQLVERAIAESQADDLGKCAMKVLHDLTPGGSEFYNDPDYCADYLRKRSQSQHEIAVKSIKRANGLEKEITALRETK